MTGRFRDVRRLVNACKRQAAYMGFGVPKLQSIAVEPTNCCNLRCVMCYSKDRPKGYIDCELYVKIVNDASALKVGLGLNFGGEALLHPRFMQMLDLANRYGLTPSFITNGHLMNKETAEGLLARSVGSIMFSVDGLVYSYTRIRGSAGYHNVVENIDYLLQLRRSKGLAKPYVSVNLVRCGQSEKEIRTYVEGWLEKGVDYVTVTDRLTPEIEIASKDELTTEYLEHRRVCRWPFKYAAVLWDGRVALCCHDLDGKTALTTNLNEKSLIDVWGGEEYRAIRKQHISLKFSDDSLCRSCEAWVWPYIPPQLTRENGVTKYRKGPSTYYTRNPDCIGVSLFSVLTTSSR